MDARAPLAVVARVARVLDELGVSYAIGGAVASSVHGIPCATSTLRFATAEDTLLHKLVWYRLGKNNPIATEATSRGSSEWAARPWIGTTFRCGPRRSA